LELEEGDVVVVATDGVLDNLFAEEIVAIVREGVSLEKSEVDVASRIAHMSSAKGFYLFIFDFCLFIYLFCSS
jgi:serine/threonine protein phosphatase PrpC